MRFESYNSQEMGDILNWLNEKNADVVAFSRINLDWLAVIDNGHVLSHHEDIAYPEPPKNRGGRPKGSKNKPKEVPNES